MDVDDDVVGDVYAPDDAGALIGADSWVYYAMKLFTYLATLD